MKGKVVAVSLSPSHSFSKPNTFSIRLIEGLGVEGDSHFGETVQHLSRIKVDPTQKNLRQVHLITQELIDELQGKGFIITPGTIGDNITTLGIDLINLPTATRLKIGEHAVIEITGLRNPCSQLDKYQQGLTAAVLDRDENGKIIRRAGVMAIVICGGDISANDEITVELPPEPFIPLERV